MIVSCSINSHDHLALSAIIIFIGVSVRFAELHYNVTEGSDVIIAILADKPANIDFSVLLTSLTTQSTTAASSMLFTSHLMMT